MPPELARSARASRPVGVPRSAAAVCLRVIAAALLLGVSACTGAATRQRPVTSPGSVDATGGAGPVAASSGREPVSPAAAPVVVRTLPVSLPAPRSDSVVFASGPSLLVAGGLTSQDTSSDAVWALDLPTARIRDAGRLAAPVHDAAGLTLVGANILVGGGSTSVVRTVQELVPGGTARTVGLLPEPRADVAALVSGGNGYVIGGYSGSKLLADVLQTSDGRTFRPVSTLPVPVRYPAVATIAGAILVAGGVTSSGAPTSAIQRIDLSTGHASIAGHLPKPLSHAAGFALGGNAYVAGGELAGGSRSRIILRIDPSGSTSRAGSLPEPLSDAGVAVTGDRAYLVGGARPATVATILEIRGTG